MRRIIVAIALFAVTSLVTVTGALAQNHLLQATVPFDFTAGDRVLPAGTYTFTSPAQNELLIESKGRGLSVFLICLANDKWPHEQPKLVFDRVGGRYFLNEIVSTSASGSLLFPPSKAEKSAKRQNAAIQGEPQTTTIAMM